MMTLLAGCNEESSTSSSSSSSSTISVKPNLEDSADHGTKEEPLTVAKFIEEAKKIELSHEQFLVIISLSQVLFKLELLLRAKQKRIMIYSV